MPVETGHRVFSFGSFEADQTAGELRKNGLRIKLHAQPFQLLLMLLERPGEVVTRDEMRKRLWGEDTFVDFDHGLNSAINKMREALGDSAAQPRYVATVSSHGYRFIAPVTASTPVSPGEAPVAEVPPAPEPPKEAASGAAVSHRAKLLSPAEELPAAPRKLVRGLLLLMQAMYLAIYLAALAHLQEIDRVPVALMAILVTSAAALIPVRLYLAAAVAFDLKRLPAKFARMFPVLLVMDLLWALSPFLLVPHTSIGLALGMSAALVYAPFAQRSLVVMYARSE